MQRLTCVLFFYGENIVEPFPLLAELNPVTLYCRLLHGIRKHTSDLVPISHLFPVPPSPATLPQPLVTTILL